MAMRTLLDTDIWSEILKAKNPTVVERARPPGLDELSRSGTPARFHVRGGVAAHRSHAPNSRAFPASRLSAGWRLGLWEAPEQTSGRGDWLQCAPPDVARSKAGVSASRHETATDVSSAPAGRFQGRAGGVAVSPGIVKLRERPGRAGVSQSDYEAELSLSIICRGKPVVRQY